MNWYLTLWEYQYTWAHLDIHTHTNWIESNRRWNEKPQYKHVAKVFSTSFFASFHIALALTCTSFAVVFYCVVRWMCVRICSLYIFFCCCWLYGLLVCFYLAHMHVFYVLAVCVDVCIPHKHTPHSSTQHTGCNYQINVNAINRKLNISIRCVIAARCYYDLYDTYDILHVYTLLCSMLFMSRCAGLRAIREKSCFACKLSHFINCFWRCEKEEEE